MGVGKGKRRVREGGREGEDWVWERIVREVGSEEWMREEIGCGWEGGRGLGKGGRERGMGE